MTVEVPVYQRTIHVDFRDVDFKKQLKLSSLFAYFQDTAGFASEEMNLGIQTLMDVYGVTWVLMRIRTDILRYPRLHEEITIETWPTDMTRVEFNRDFFVRDQNGEVIIKGVSTWVLMDLETRRIKRTNIIETNYPRTNWRAIHCDLGKIRDFGNLETAYRKTIGYSDVDINGHLTNSKYVDYIMDCFSVQDHQENHIHSLEVNYLQEAFPGETLILQKDISQLEERIVFVEGIKEADGKTAFRALFSFTPKEENHG